ncbi:MAG: HAMP domain-containing protein [Myxococcales bacterium]|nr:HAMP domain-containing protein [Myxococcales bacterium]
MHVGLRTKVLTALTLVVLVGVFLVYLTTTGLQSSFLRQDRLAQAEFIARIVTTSVASYDLSDSKNRDLVFADLTEALGAHGLFLLGSDGLPAASVEKARLGMYLPEASIQLLAEQASNPPFSGYVNVAGGESIAVITAMPQEEDTAASRLLMLLPAERLSLSDFHSDKVIVLFALVLLALVVLIGYLMLTRIIVEPVRRLTREVERLRPDPSGRHDVNSPQRDPGDEVAQLYASFNRLLARLRDYQADTEIKIRDLRSMNRQLETTQETLVRTEKLASVGVLTAGIAHEIGNPISVSLGYLEMLKRGDCTAEEVALFVDQIDQSTRRVSSIIRDLLDFSRASPKEDDPFPRCDAVEVVERTLKLLAPQKRFKSITVQRHFEAPQPFVAIDDGRLEQVVLNLLLNAADSMQGHGAVHIHIKDNGANFVTLAVQDEGCGIARRDLLRIFDPFFTTKGPGVGTGLGLAITHQIVTAFGGRVDVESEVNKGTTFFLQLKRAA